MMGTGYARVGRGELANPKAGGRQYCGAKCDKHPLRPDFNELEFRKRATMAVEKADNVGVSVLPSLDRDH